MKDDPEDPPSNYPLTSATAKMSKTPSWVMLGFCVGAIFVYAMMRQDQATAPPTVSVHVVGPPRPVEPREAMPLSTIEAVFEVWKEHVVWFDQTAEVALWNSKELAYSEFYEVRRIGDIHYFRSIPKLTRRIVRHGKELPDSPLQFTETEEQYREWREHGRTERRVERELRPVGSSLPNIAPPRANPTGPLTGGTTGPTITPPPPLPEPVLELTPKAKK